jgi:hypothetical protein
MPKQIDIETLRELMDVLEYLYNKHGDLPVYMDIEESYIKINAVTYTTDEDKKQCIALHSF